MTETYKLYRKDSPSTSVEAAKSFEPNKLEALVLGAIRYYYSYQ